MVQLIVYGRCVSNRSVVIATAFGGGQGRHGGGQGRHGDGELYLCYAERLWICTYVCILFFYLSMTSPLIQCNLDIHSSRALDTRWSDCD